MSMTARVTIDHDFHDRKTFVEANLGENLVAKIMEEVKARAHAEQRLDQMRTGDAALRRRELRCRMKRKVRK